MVDLKSYIRKGSLPPNNRPVTAVVPPLTAREREHQEHFAQGGTHQIGRDPRRPKNIPDIVPPHPGMHTSIRGADVKHLVGITETTYKNIPDASGATPMDPTIVGKPGTVLQAVPGHRSRSGEIGPGDCGGGRPGQSTAERNAGRGHDPELGRRVLDDAIQFAKGRR